MSFYKAKGYSDHDGTIWCGLKLGGRGPASFRSSPRGSISMQISEVV
jgi:hypothetical protein